MAKKTLSKKQLAALAKGRAKRAAKVGRKSAKKSGSRATLSTLTKRINTIRRKGRKIAKRVGKKEFYFTGAKPAAEFKPLLISEVKTMARKKARKSSKKTRRYGSPVALSGKKRTRRSRRPRLYSGILGGGKSDIVKQLINTALAVAGGVGGSFAANKLPIPDARLKAAAPIALGAVIGMTKFGRKNPMIQAVSSGMMVAGGLALLKQLAPNMPLLAGETDPIETEAAALLGGPVNLGEEFSLLGDEGEIEAYTSPATL